MVVFLLSSCDNNNEVTIKQQLLNEMKDNEKDVDEIIHLEVVEDGILVFYTLDNKLYDGFLKLKNAKWEWSFGGGSLPLQTKNDFNWLFSNLDDFYVRYGVITDSNIKRIKDKDNNDAKIIQSEDGLRIYFFINKSVVFDNKKKQTQYSEIIPVYEN